MFAVLPTFRPAYDPAAGLRAAEVQARIENVQFRMARRRKKVENAWFRRVFRFVAAAVE